MRDDSVLTTVRPISDLNELYSQWAEYRVDIVEERCRRLVRKVRERKRVGRDFDVVGVKAELEELAGVLQRTAAEIVDEAEEKRHGETLEREEGARKRARRS